MDSTTVVSEVVSEMKKNTDVMFQKYFVPRLEQHLDLKMHQWLESIVEKKIEERFAFAIQLLHSMNQQAMEPIITVDGQKDKPTNGA